MSGDVQPRKRRDKKKKKDEPEETIPHQHFARAPTPPTNNDDVNIHIYKETSTGGGICAKFVFFILLGALAVLIGLIITEHRGLTDLDTIETETRFSQYFEGWVDKTPDDHDDHKAHVEESHEHEEEEHDDHDEHDEHDEHEEEEEEEHASEEEEHVSEEEEQASEEDHGEDEDELVSEEAASEEDDAVASDENDAVASDEDVQDTQEDDDDQDESVQEDSAQEDDSQGDDYENDVAEEDDQSGPQASQEEDDDEKTESGGVDDADDDSQHDEQDDSQHDEQDEDDGPVSTEEPASEEKQNDEDVSTETVVVGDEGGDADEDGEADEAAEEAELTNAEVAVKIGVGVAILVVAYVVLVRKWKSDKLNEEKNVKIQEVPLDLSRRNTIVVPPKVEVVEQQVVDNDDEEYSEEEVEEVVKLHPKVKQDYQQLRHTYERSLTPESDPNKYDDEEYEEEEEIEDEEEVEEEEEVDEEEEEEEEDEPVSDVDDEDLMKKFEAKYGKLETKPINDPEEEEVEEEYEEEEEEEEEDEHYQWKRPTPSAPQSYDSDDENTGAQAVYDFENITNTDDYEIRDQLDNAQQHIDNNAALAVALFNKILDSRPKSARALYGKARSLDNLADTQRSNELLKDSVENYLQVVQVAATPAVLFLQAAERCINRLRFIGHYGRAVSVHKLLIDKFPDEVKYRNQLAVTYLTINRISEARQVLKDTLKRWPNDGFALVHYGFILKVNDNKLERSIEFLRRGLASGEDGVVDGRFYFHLGDALTRLGKHNEATDVFKDGVANKVFLSLYQRSLYNVNHLTGRPWWKKEQAAKYASFYKLLEENYRLIRNEGLSVMNEKGFFQDEAENLRDVGDWKQFELFARGIKNKDNCKKCPVTCKILESFPDSYGCRRGQIKFSVMHPGTHVWPHCGPTNCRLRVHLGLKVPPKTYIRVAEEIRSWEEGKVFIFDDSFEHEVWHNGSEFRLVLIADVWHPELTVREKQSLSAI